MSVATVQKYIDGLKEAGKPVLAFCLFWRDRIPDEFFREIYTYLEDSFSMFTLTCLKPDEYSMHGPVFNMEKEEICHLQHIDIIVVVDAYQHNTYPRDSFVAAFPHSFGACSEPINYIGLLNNMAHFDAYLTPCPITAEGAALIRDAYEYTLSPAHIHREKYNYFFIPVGDPRIAGMYRKMQQTTCVQDSIMYAPTNFSYNEGDFRKYMVRDYGTAMVGKILEAFPQYRMVYRPDFHAWNDPQTLNVIDKYKNYPNFYVSKDTDHLPEFARAAVVITDYSNIGESFAFSCLRPEIRTEVETPLKQVCETFSGLLINPAFNIVTALEICLSKGQAYWKEHIQRCFGSYILAPDKTMEYIKQTFLGICQGRFPENSVGIKRNVHVKPWTEVDYIRKIFRHDGINTTNLEYFQQDFPDDPIPFAIHLAYSKQFTPVFYLSEKDYADLKKFLGLVIDDKAQFQDIEDTWLLLLFQKGLLRLKQNRQSRYQAVAAGVLDNLSTAFAWKTH